MMKFYLFSFKILKRIVDFSIFLLKKRIVACCFVISKKKIERNLGTRFWSKWFVGNFQDGGGVLVKKLVIINY